MSQAGWAAVDTVMFDFDGTLVSSLDCYHAVFVDAFHRLGMPVVGKEALLALMRDGRNVLDALIPAEWPDRDEAKRTCSRLFRELWAERSLTAVTLQTEAVQTVTELKTSYRLGIATAAEGAWIEQLLVAHGLRPLFSAVVTYAEVPVRKPAPDVLLECLRRLGSQAETSIYVGDSPIDIIAAKAAGVRSIGVLSGASDRASLEAVEPDLLLAHVGELPAALDARRLGQEDRTSDKEKAG